LYPEPSVAVDLAVETGNHKEGKGKKKGGVSHDRLLNIQSSVHVFPQPFGTYRPATGRGGEKKKKKGLPTCGTPDVTGTKRKCRTQVVVRGMKRKGGGKGAVLLALSPFATRVPSTRKSSFTSVAYGGEKSGGGKKEKKKIKEDLSL